METYDANIGTDDIGTPANLAHTSDDGRVAHVWVPWNDFAMARTATAASCVPSGYELIGWNTAGRDNTVLNQDIQVQDQCGAVLS